MKLSILIAVLFVALCSAVQKQSPRPCNVAYKCSLEDDPAWTTDGKKCYVFRNPCHLANENCHRQNSYKPVLESVSKEACQALCRPRCTRIMKPICGYYNDMKRQFSNQCLMDYHICSTGETYMLFNEGRCEEPLTLTS